MEAYLVTDRQLVSDRSLIDRIREAASAGVERVQVREKDLGGAALFRLAREIKKALEGTRSTLFINDRVDVAMAVGAAGVHLGRTALPALTARRIGGEDLVVGVSCHNLQEALEAQEVGADYLFFGPVFPTPGKAAYGPPVGVSKLEEVLRKVRVPVYAIGGITPERLEALRALPLTGVAMVSAFVRAPSVADLVREVHRESWQ